MKKRQKKFQQKPETAKIMTFDEVLTTAKNKADVDTLYTQDAARLGDLQFKVSYLNKQIAAVTERMARIDQRAAEFNGAQK